MSLVHMLTTTDNPYDPFDQYDRWLQFDTSRGHNTPAYLARVVQSSVEFPESLAARKVEQAIDEIIAFNGPETYRKVSREIDGDDDDRIPLD